MTAHASFEIMHSQCTDKVCVIRDVGPHDRFKTITNDAEDVVERLLAQGFLSKKKRLWYYDSMGELDEILHDGKKFIGFAPVPPGRAS